MKHKECEKDEYFVGNVRIKKDFSYLDGVKFRLGEQAFDINGEKISKNYMRPLIIKKRSFEKYESILDDLFKKASRGRLPE